MNRSILRCALAGAAAAALCATALPGAAQRPMTSETAAASAVLPPMPAEQMQNGIRYLAGGVGLNAREHMEAMAGRYNLRLSFAATVDRHYVPDVDVAIKDANGRTLLEVADAGPLFHARLPSGTYRVEVSYHGVRQTRTVSLDGGVARANFFWKEVPPA
ncbi:MAG: carboxypeptidase regulatory-like domain-containing protein [Burkholderiales bacterium]|nr:carboxypeptidase regulatory-like domain-containing protein [Burkholderiales bacterium]